MLGGAVQEAGDRLGLAIQSGMGRLTEQLGGPARRRVIVILACVLGLQAADIGTIAALAFQLE
ncbi:MAG TPA: hypothetical protein VEJ21_01190, partial [Acidimicrobiales bacterium]|nr:hypothetical protein [Acidimicrobiales bacterium]